MEPEFLKSLYSEYPFLLLTGPLSGLLLQKLKEMERLAGLALLGAALGINATVIAAYGFSQNWNAAEWHKAPFAVLVAVALSNLVGATVEHLQQD